MEDVDGNDRFQGVGVGCIGDAGRRGQQHRAGVGYGGPPGHCYRGRDQTLPYSTHRSESAVGIGARRNSGLDFHLGR